MIGVLLSVVGAFYYLRIVKIMYFDEPAKAFDRQGAATRIVLALSTAVVIFLRARAGAFDQRGDGRGQVAVLNASDRASGIADLTRSRAGAWSARARLDSTNDEARRRALAGDPGGLWILADEQTAGRGRQGRVWASPPGNLYASALIRRPLRGRRSRRRSASSPASRCAARSRISGFRGRRN